MADDIKCMTDSRMKAMEIIKQKMVEMKNQNEALITENAELKDRAQTLGKSYEEMIVENENLSKRIKDMEESSSTIQDELMSRVNILKEDLHDADRRADNSERQVIFLLKKVQEQEDMITKYMTDYKGTGQFIDDSMNELLDI